MSACCVWLKLPTLASTTAARVISRPQLPIPTNPRLLCCTTWVQNTLLGALSGALSLGLLFSLPPSAIALLEPPSLQTCPDVEPQQEVVHAGPEVVTNEGLVEEAWQIVNDSFLDTGRHRWSQDTWQVTASHPPHIKILHLFIIIGYFIDEF